MEGVCIYLKKAACDWADARLDPGYCSQSCNLADRMDKQKKRLARSVSVVSLVENIEEAFKQTVAFSKLYHLGITTETLTDISVVLREQQHRIQQMSVLVKETIAQDINVDPEYRIPDKALADLNLAQLLLHDWNEAVVALGVCVKLGHSSNSCSTIRMSSIHVQHTQAMEGVCTHLKKAACDWADVRLGP